MFIVMAPHEKRIEKKSERAEPTDGVVTAEAAGGGTIGEALAAKGMAPTATVEPEPTEQTQDAKDEDPQGNGQAL